MGDLFGERLPDEHRRFLHGLESMAVVGDYVFAHAGLRPGVPLERQHRDDLLWIREDFTAVPHWHGKRVVHGHTIETHPAVHPWRIGIDTGAYATGALCCLVLEGAEASPGVFRTRR
jgi:serine/threonine protein phosphatase 1